MTSNQKPSIQTLREQNKQLEKQIKEASTKQSQLAQKLTNDIQQFQQSSKKTLNEMSQQILAESGQAHTLLADLTNKYQGVLKEQIKLLTQNQKLVQKKEEEQEKFKGKIDEISQEYEKKISQIQKQLKDNMNKVADLQGSGMIRILLKSERFRQQIIKRGGNVDVIIQKTEQEALYKKINQKQLQIKSLEKSNEQIDQQVGKMQQMMLTFNQLLQNMKQERINLQAQNKTLTQKLTDSRAMLSQIMQAQK